jgi:YD repeat-containing protein
LIYNARSPLIRLIQGEDITNFTYDARGVMTRIKTTDGSVFALIYDANHKLTQLKHNGKAITAAYVATLLGEVKATVAKTAIAFFSVLTDEMLNALITEPTTTTISRKQARRERSQTMSESECTQLEREIDREQKTIEKIERVIVE